MAEQKQNWLRRWQMRERATRQVVRDKVFWEKRRLMRMAMAVFLGETVVIVAVNSFVLGYGFHLDYSISKYVGLETWSSLMFAALNGLVVYGMGAFLLALGESWKMKSWYFWVIVFMTVGLVGLSVFPCEYFESRGLGTTITVMHQLTSQMMFFNMLVIAIAMGIRSQVGTGMRFWCAMFVVYGAMCVIGFLGEKGWFMSRVLIFETLYLFSFMLLCMEILKRGGLLAKIGENELVKEIINK